MFVGSSLDKIQLQPESTQYVINYLCKLTNIKLECYKEEFLERRIKLRMNRLNLISDEEYFEYMLRTPSEYKEFRNTFTINYTYFFRNYEIYKALMQYFINHKIKRKNSNVLNIWSAPCSTGEEPYSLAIMFDFMKKNNIQIPDFEIVASDIDCNALNRAKEGVYEASSLYEFPAIYASYFTEKKTKFGSKFLINDDIKKKVTFIQEDLIGGHSYKEQYDIIFCRNFLIYLNRDSQRKVIKTLSKHLISQGFLVIGKTEILHDSTCSDFHLLNPKTHFYSKV